MLFRSIYESEETMVYLSAKEKKKIYNRIKKDNSLVNLEEIKESYISKTILNLENERMNIENEEINVENEEMLKIESDYSIINDEYIEKYSTV